LWNPEEYLAHIGITHGVFLLHVFGAWAYITYLSPIAIIQQAQLDISGNSTLSYTPWKELVSIHDITVMNPTFPLALYLPLPKRVSNAKNPPVPLYYSSPLPLSLTLPLTLILYPSPSLPPHPTSHIPHPHIPTHTHPHIPHPTSHIPHPHIPTHTHPHIPQTQQQDPHHHHHHDERTQGS